MTSYGTRRSREHGLRSDTTWLRLPVTFLEMSRGGCTWPLLFQFYLLEPGAKG